MKKILCLFGALTVLLASCSNDDSSEKAVNAILPKTIKITNPGYPSENSNGVLTYEGNKLVSISNEERRTDYTYEGNLIVKAITYDIVDGKNDKTVEESYKYSNGKLSASFYVRNFTWEYPFGQYAGRSVYTYQNDGTLKRERYSTNSETKVEKKDNYDETLTFQNGNLIKLVAIDTNSSLGNIRTSIYEFDQKSNPYKNVLGYNLLIEEENTNANNLVKHTYSYAGSESILHSNKTSYEYDTNGYPVKQTYYKSDGVTVSEIIEYTY